MIALLPTVEARLAEALEVLPFASQITVCTYKCRFVQAASGTFNETRRAAGPPGSHRVSGSWQPGELQEVNEAARTYAYQMTNEQFSMQWNGQSYNAKFDGKQYPVHGDPGGTTVTVKRLNDRTIDETDHRQGKVTDEIRLAAASDGNTIEVTDNDVIRHQITTFTLEKQQH